MVNNRRIALVSAGISRKEYPQFARFMPMTAVGLHYIKANLEDQGYDIKIINQTNDGLSDLETANEIDNYNPGFVLFNQFFSTRERIRDKIIPNIKGKYVFGVGGHDATFNSKELSKEEIANEYSQFDFIWQGEAEKDLGEFLNSFEKENAPVITGDIENRVRDLDQLKILKHDDYSGDIGFLSTSRGCLPKNAACDFCTTGGFYPDGWKARSLEHVKPELENLVKSGKRYIFVTDDNFLGFSQKDLDRGDAIIEYASDLKLKLMIMTTKEQILKANEKRYLEKWKGTVFRTFLGIENGSRSSAIKLGKCSARHNEEYTSKCEEAISALYDNGISLFSGYINFNPATTISELEESVSFLRDNGREAANFTNLSQGLRFYEGTSICKRFSKQAKNYKMKKGECFYEFENPKVQDIYEHLSELKNERNGLMDIIDNLNYEITDLVYINQIQDTTLGKEYFELAEKRNKLNSEYFLRICSGVSGDKERFLEESEKLLGQYQDTYDNIRSLMEHK